MIRLSLFLVLFSGINFVDASSDNAFSIRAPDVVPTRAFGAPAISARHRILQNMNNGKNNAKTALPTAAPSELPSGIPSDMPSESPAPSPSPTGAPSPNPSQLTGAPFTSVPLGTSEFTGQPSLSNDIFSPSAKAPEQTLPSATLPTSVLESESDVVGGLMNLTLSLLAPGVTQLSVLVGQKTALVETVEETLNYYLCADTDIVLLNDKNEFACKNRRRRRTQGDTPLSSVLADNASITVGDRSVQGVNYTEWRLSYRVLSIGTSVQIMAEDNGESPLETLQSVAQLAVVVRINDGDMDERLGDGHQVSVVGEEEATWLEETEEYYFEPLDPKPLHSLRIAGIVMLFMTSVVTWFTLHLAKKRRMEREWDAEFQQRGKGGLVTEEGVDYILAVGRRRSQQMQGTQPRENNILSISAEAEGILSDGDEDERTLPLPGYMSVDANGTYDDTKASTGSSTLKTSAVPA